MLELDSKGPARIKHHSGEKVFLLPGQWYFGHTGATVKTLLGSCIAVTLWHPKRHMGGMCHFLLPTRPRTPDGSLDGRFGDEAVELLAHEIKKSGTKTQDYEVHLYGGADTMPDQAKVKFNIGERNVEKAWEIIDKYGFQLQCVDVGGNEPRNVTIDLTNGQVVLRRGNPHTARKG
ncbi:MAG: chemotaxis protein CheD [Aquabacterium sp.]|uniref:chemotaxis protein CheD n=1 Tax=Aquabacterium sp. TaxID=1872578 RepID=UPI0025B9053A|nr:chemotaxis protein CheD [Aquabacterium sp.]MBI5926036.1 chemotaxis protein CheD [Aquabacterium sp.]